MDWNEALLNIDVMKNKKDIVLAIKDISKNPDKGVDGINKLIANHQNDHNLIQKYAETQLATNSIHLTISAYFTALAALMLSLAALIPSLTPIAMPIVNITSGHAIILIMLGIANLALLGIAILRQWGTIIKALLLIVLLVLLSIGILVLLNIGILLLLGIGILLLLICNVDPRINRDRAIIIAIEATKSDDL